MIVEDLLKLIQDGTVEATKAGDVIESITDRLVEVECPPKGNSRAEIISTLEYFITNSSEYLLSFFYVEKIIKALFSKYFDASSDQGLINKIEGCLNKLVINLQEKSPSTLTQFFEFSYVEFKKVTLMSTAQTVDRGSKLLKRYEVICHQLSLHSSKIFIKKLIFFQFF